jgi:hypothetical protein
LGLVARRIKNALELNFLAVPKEGEQYGEKGWLFAILARMLEDKGFVDHKKEVAPSIVSRGLEKILTSVGRYEKRLKRHQ